MVDVHTRCLLEIAQGKRHPHALQPNERGL